MTFTLKLIKVGLHVKISYKSGQSLNLPLKINVRRILYLTSLNKAMNVINISLL